MKVCGIIAEYNPFHSGHAYQIARARELSGCDYLIAVMSGDFVQRGAPALMEKYVRARMALLEGADLVLMLPVYASTASAEGFARAGVSALLTAGVDAISFGCEDTAICSEDYRHLTYELSQENDACRAALTASLSAGLPYAKARVEAVKSCYGSHLDLSLLDTPNNLLAFEYIRALSHFGSDMELIPVKRLGNYHDTDCSQSANTPDQKSNSSASYDYGRFCPADGTFASASACRRSLLTDTSGELEVLQNARQIPQETCRILADYAATYPLIQEDDLSLALHYALLTQKEPGYESYLDCGSDLSARIKSCLHEYQSLSGFCNRLKNKSVTRARIARALPHILLQLPARMPQPLLSDDGLLPYLRVLGFRQSATPLLHEIKTHAKAPLITRVPDAERVISEKDMCYFNQDLFASEIYRSVVLQKCGHCYPDDYRRRIEIV